MDRSVNEVSDRFLRSVYLALNDFNASAVDSCTVGRK